MRKIMLARQHVSSTHAQDDVGAGNLKARVTVDKAGEET